MAEPVGGVGAATAVGTGPAVDVDVAVPGALSPLLPGADASMLALLSSRSADQQIRSAGEKALNAVKEAANQRQERLEQLRKQVEREEDATFWDKVAIVGQIVAIAASVVAACFSGGSALVITAALVTAAWSGANLATKGHLLEDIGVSKDAAPWVNLGVTVALALCSCGATTLSGGAQGAGTAGQVAAGTSRAASTATQTAAATTQTAAAATRTAASTGNLIGQGIAVGFEIGGEGLAIGGGYGKGVCEADAAEHVANAGLAGALVDAARRERREAIDSMREASEMQRRIVDLAIEMEQAKNKASQTALRRA